MSGLSVYVTTVKHVAKHFCIWLLLYTCHRNTSVYDTTVTHVAETLPYMISTAKDTQTHRNTDTQTHILYEFARYGWHYPYGLTAQVSVPLVVWDIPHGESPQGSSRIIPVWSWLNPIGKNSQAGRPYRYTSSMHMHVYIYICIGRDNIHTFMHVYVCIHRHAHTHVCM